METIEIKPVTKELDLDHVRVEIYLDGSWSSFCTTDEHYDIKPAMRLFAQWNFLNSPMRVVTKAGHVVCTNGNTNF